MEFKQNACKYVYMYIYIYIYIYTSQIRDREWLKCAHGSNPKVYFCQAAHMRHRISKLKKKPATRLRNTVLWRAFL
jgi:hypothetical protein